MMTLQSLMLIYDGTNMQMLSQPASAGGRISYADLQGIPATFPPAPHGSTHGHRGGDKIGTVTAAANTIPKADANGRLSGGWLPAPAAPGLGGVRAADCSATGFVQKVNTDGTVTCAAGGTGSGSSPVDWSSITNKPAAYINTVLDTSTVSVTDEFSCGGNYPANMGFCLPWYTNGGAGTANNLTAGTRPHLGVFKVGGSAAAGNFGGIVLEAGTNSVVPLGTQAGLMAQGPWELHWIFMLNQTSNTRAYIGLRCPILAINAASSFIGARFDTHTGIADSTEFIFAANSGTAVSDGVAVDTGWHHLKISWLSSGKLAMSLDGQPAKTACPSGCDITTTWSSSATTTPVALCGSDDTAAAQSMSLDCFGFLAQVGER